MSWIDNLDTVAIAHEHRIEFKVNDNLNLEQVAAVGVGSLEHLRWMQGLCHDIFALFGVCPKLDLARCVPYVLAHTNYIVEECAWIEIRVLLELNVNGFHTLNAVERKVIKHKILLPATKEEPTVAEFLEQIWVHYILHAAARCE